ncbi:MAG: alkaline phosphatase family protein [Promethearchaeota archaeon]
MNKIFIVIFIDALSYKRGKKFFKKLQNEMKDLSLIKLTPGIGYSFNLHWEIFEGLNPDKLESFTDISIKFPKKIKQSRYINKLYSFFDQTLFANFFMRSFLRLIGSKRNIPLSEKEFFYLKNDYLFNLKDDSSFVDLFNRKMKIIKHEDLNVSFERAKIEIDKGNINTNIIIENLDHIGHLYGGSSEQYEKFSEIVFNKIIDFIFYLKRKQKKMYFLIISDHGMVDVKLSIDLQSILFDKFGVPGNNYFSIFDSVYLRIWGENNKIVLEIYKFLNSLEILKILNKFERKRYGITKSIFGDIIGVLKEGYIFSPNNFCFFLKKLPRGMHGYIENSENASGVIMTNLKEFNKMNEVKVSEVYRLITNSL